LDPPGSIGFWPNSIPTNRVAAGAGAFHQYQPKPDYPGPRANRRNRLTTDIARRTAEAAQRSFADLMRIVGFIAEASRCHGFSHPHRGWAEPPLTLLFGGQAATMRRIATAQILITSCVDVLALRTRLLLSPQGAGVGSGRCQPHAIAGAGYSSSAGAGAFANSASLRGAGGSGAPFGHESADASRQRTCP